jgi:hypothetical protein
MTGEQPRDCRLRQASVMSWPRIVSLTAAVATILGGLGAISLVPSLAEPVAISQGKWAGSPDFFFTVAGDQMVDISWTQFVASWNNKPCKVCMAACPIKDRKVDCEEGKWQQDGKPDRPAFRLVGSFDDPESFTGFAKSAGCSFVPCGQSGGGMMGADYTTRDVNAQPTAARKAEESVPYATPK